ncbi:type II secretion system protein [candidate division WS5 bacterium]|uniref:Type II secretion system protein n=1 Tax=candidate division WS5 bacterium TaxID=2093353 RepID=A0A419DG13_9BACT|nr:MAG: type II secretion system protein [candidate division WS5 bacterium]
MKKNILKNQGGMTLIELIVSMGIFAVVMTLTVGFFVRLQQLQMTYRDKADLHQEGRILSEIFSRYAGEAEQVIQSGTDLCASNTNYIAFKFKNSTGNTGLAFACTQDSPQNPRYIRMGEVDTSLLPGVIGDMPYLSSGQVTVTKFEVKRGDIATYPKTLRYNIEVDRFLSSGSAGAGEKIHFPGYLVMNNEH